MKMQFNVVVFKSIMDHSPLRWIIGAAVVNAFYSPNRNQIGKRFASVEKLDVFFFYCNRVAPQ